MDKYAFDAAIKVAENKLRERVRVVMPHGNNRYLMETLWQKRWPETVGQRRFPGGGVADGETREQAAVRELREELGLTVEPSSLQYIGRDHRPEMANEHYFMLPSHGLQPGDYADADNPGIPIKLRSMTTRGPKFVGADPRKLMAAAGSAKAAAEQTRDSRTNKQAFDLIVTAAIVKLAAQHKAAAGPWVSLAKAITRSVPTAAKITPVANFAKNTFKPGYRQVRSQLSGVRIERNADLKSQGLMGDYRFGVARVDKSLSPVQKQTTLRHELAHGLQFRNPANPHLANYQNSLPGKIKHLNWDGSAKWNRTLSGYLGEVHSNAASYRSIPGQIYGAAKFMLDPVQAISYAMSPGYGSWRYGLIHGATAAPTMLAAPKAISAALAAYAGKRQPVAISSRRDATTADTLNKTEKDAVDSFLLDINTDKQAFDAMIKVAENKLRDRVRAVMPRPSSSTLTPTKTFLSATPPAMLIVSGTRRCP